VGWRATLISSTVLECKERSPPVATITICNSGRCLYLTYQMPGRISTYFAIVPVSKALGLSIYWQEMC